MDISTFDNLALRGEKTVEILDGILQEFVLPFDIKLVIQTEKISGRKKMYTFSDKNWAKIIKFLLNGEMQHVLIRSEEDSKIDQKYYNSSLSLSVTCDYIQKYRNFDFIKKISNNLSFSISERQLSFPISKESQNRWVGLFKNSFKKLNGINGYLTRGYTTASFSPNITQLEGSSNLSYFFHSQNFDQVVRGYYWGNIISERHIEKLGGFEKVFNAPVQSVEKLEFNNREAVYMQLTADINCYSDEQLKMLKEFYNVILPE